METLQPNPSTLFKFSAKARRKNAATSLADMLGFTPAVRRYREWPADHTAAWLRRQAGVSLGIYLGDWLADQVSQGSFDADQLGRVLAAELRSLETLAVLVDE